MKRIDARSIIEGAVCEEAPVIWSGPPVEVPDGVEVPVLLGGEADPVLDAAPEPEPEPEPEPDPELDVGTETADEATPAFPETCVEPTLLLAEDEAGAAVLDCGTEMATGAVFETAGA